MRFTISGFGGASKEGQETPAVREAEPVSAAPRKSVVQVCFPETGRSLAYYNDRFNLKAGDRVYVSGKLEGVLGIVTSVNYNFRIRLSEYQKVIFQVNTRVHGRFYMSASHFITFDSTALPAAQVTSWFRAPVGEGEEFASGNDDFPFSLEHLEEMKVTNAIAERGHDTTWRTASDISVWMGQRGMQSWKGQKHTPLNSAITTGKSGIYCATAFAAIPASMILPQCFSLRRRWDTLPSTMRMSTSRPAILRLSQRRHFSHLPSVTVRRAVFLCDGERLAAPAGHCLRRFSLKFHLIAPAA